MSGNRSPARRAIREIVFVAALFLAYKLGRLLVEGHVTEAFTNARDVWTFERLIHLPSEASPQASAIGHTWLIRAANCFYAYVHFPATALALIWIYLRRPDIYLWFRRTLASLTALALITHAFFPLAPPRMLATAGLVDTGRIYGPSVYGSPTTDTLSNQYAAMPSLHVGWALAVAIALIAATRSRWRWLWLAHPLTTLLVVVVTGNHYWLDAIAAVGLLSLVLAVVTPLSRTAAAVPPPAVPTPAVPPAVPTPAVPPAVPTPAVPTPAAPPAVPTPAMPPATVSGPVPAHAAAGPEAVVPDGGDSGPGAAEPGLVPVPLAAAAHPLLAPCVQLATLVPGAPLTAFLPDLLAPPEPEPRLAKATIPPVPKPRPAPATLEPPPIEPQSRSQACLPSQPDAASAPSRPPSSPAVTRPGPAAPRSRTTRKR